MEFSLNQIASIIDGRVEGDGTLMVSRIDKIQEGTIGSVTFLSNAKYEPLVYETKASAVIVSEDFVPQRPIAAVLIRVKNPYNGLTRLLEVYERIVKGRQTGVEEPSYFDESSVIGDNHYRGAFSYVGKNSTFGDNVRIFPHSYIGDNVKVGSNVTIHAGVKIYNNTIIGDFCTIHPGAVIGADGFGFAPQEDGTYKTIPQLGNVVLEDHVSIGANTAIDCATMGSTLIKKGVKIDNLVQIAHNVTIGENTVIASQTGISGSTTIGKNCVIAGQVGIVGHIRIADNTTLGAKTGIIKAVDEPGKTLFGYIGFEVKEFLKSYSVFKKLPDMQAKIKELEKKI